MLHRIFITCIILLSVFFGLSCTDNTVGKTYDITYYCFDNENGTVPEKQIKEHGVDITLASNSGDLCRAGHALIGWSTAYDGGGTKYQLGEVYSSNADLSLYAVWVTGYTVSYDANNATAGIVPVTQTKAEAINLILEENTGNLVKTAYGFCGWNTEPDGSGIKYTSGEEYADDADLTLYAMWYDVGWAGSVDTGINDTEFLAVAADDSGNVWTAGYQTNDGAYTYAGQTASGFYASGKNAVLVKFDSDGNGLWAKTPENETLPFDTVFNSIALDSSGNAYAVGYISGNGVFTFNSGITAAANHAGISSILVKFDPGGNAVWARTVTDGVANSEFLSVTVEGTDVYASGYQTNTGGFNYSGPIVNGAAANENAVLVKFDTDGNTQWAMTTAAGDYATSFDDIVIDSAGYIYAAGYKFDTPASDFGGPIATGTFGGNNALIVKYDPAGAPQWAKSPTTGSNISYFNSITVDNSGNIFAAG
ncbi:MAG TPA: hypothetical protein DCO79_03145, partial [Spirochaeta sp.]|nr:hypothetical protein [Spirochaeta sp.]